MLDCLGQNLGIIFFIRILDRADAFVMSVLMTSWRNVAIIKFIILPLCLC